MLVKGIIKHRKFFDFAFSKVIFVYIGILRAYIFTTEIFKTVIFEELIFKT